MATSSQVVTSSLPSAFESFYTTPNTGLIAQASKLFGAATPADYAKTYVEPLKAANLYGEQRIAPMSEAQKKLGAGIMGMTTPEQFGMATQGLTGLPSLASSTDVQKYMSPFVMEALAPQMREAVLKAQQTQLGANLQAPRYGTYGGSRQLMAQMERERNLGQLLGDIRSKGMQTAFEAAQKGITDERAAAIQRSQVLGQLGTAQQAADLDRFKTLGAYGDLERAIAQQGIDTRYEDVMNAIQYPETQLGKMTSFLRGIPLTDQTRTTTTPPPSFASQLASMGLAGLSLYNLFNPRQG